MGPVAETQVCHVVHVVVAPERRPGTDSDAFAKRRYAELTAERSRLRSYSLYVVRPGTAAFENLVSQPIALTVPDMEAHVDASWQVKLPACGEPTATYLGVKDLTATPWVFADANELEEHKRVVRACKNVEPRVRN